MSDSAEQGKRRRDRCVSRGFAVGLVAVAVVVASALAGGSGRHPGAARSPRPASASAAQTDNRPGGPAPAHEGRR